MDLHVAPPLTSTQVLRRHPWVLPAATVVFVSLAMGAMFHALPWDGPITAWVVHPHLRPRGRSA